MPVAGSDERLLKVTHCALCRTDAKMWQKGHRDLVLPRIMGHEICGISVENGKRFVAWPGRACGHCDPCRKGHENLCSEMQITGFHKNGGLAEYVGVAESGLTPVPDGLPGDIASLAEPLACGINALQQTGLGKEDKLLIYGAGTVGLLMSLAARAQDAVPFIRDICPAKLAKSEDFRDKIGVACAEKSGNPDFDVVVNAAPASETFLKGLCDLKPGGCFCLFSGLTDALPIPVSALNDIHYRQLRVVGAYGCTRDQMKMAVDILRDFKTEVKCLIEDHVELKQVPAMLSKILEGKALKFVVRF